LYECPYKAPYDISYDTMIRHKRKEKYLPGFPTNGDFAKGPAARDKPARNEFAAGRTAEPINYLAMLL
jgi:hypothetical protein